jgi:hypothetical protein
VLAVLAAQNRTLAELAKNSDTVLAPLARRKAQVANFIVQANRTGQATAEVHQDISASIARFPAFLRQLQPTLADLGALADQMTPVITDLGKAAPGLNRFTEELGPFSTISIPAVKSLGEAADVGTPALVASEPVANDLRQLATNADPVSKSLDALQKSLTATGAVNHLMDYLFFQMQAVNGFDSIGHYLRAGLILNACSTYVVTPQPGCSANFSRASSSAAASASSLDPTDPVLQNTHNAILRALSGKGGLSSSGTGVPVSTPGRQPSFLQRFLSLAKPNTEQQRQAALNRIRRGASNQGSDALGQADPALNYLLGP